MVSFSGSFLPILSLPASDYCCYLDFLNFWASVAQYEPIKGQSDEGGPTASPMIKSSKDGEEEEESTCS